MKKVKAKVNEQSSSLIQLLGMLMIGFAVLDFALSWMGVNLTSFQVDGGSYIKKDVHIGGNLNISDSASILAAEATFNTEEVVFDNPLLLALLAGEPVKLFSTGTLFTTGMSFTLLFFFSVFFPA